MSLRACPVYNTHTPTIKVQYHPTPPPFFNLSVETKQRWLPHNNHQQKLPIDFNLINHKVKHTKKARQLYNYSTLYTNVARY